MLPAERLDEAEPARGRLDARRGVDRRERRGECLVPRLELPALLVELRDGDMRAENRDVHRDDAEEKEGEDGHPDDVAADVTLRGLARRAYGRCRTPGRSPSALRRRCALDDLRRGEPVDGRH